MEPLEPGLVGTGFEWTLPTHFRTTVPGGLFTVQTGQMGCQETEPTTVIKGGRVTPPRQVRQLFLSVLPKVAPARKRRLTGRLQTALLAHPAPVLPGALSSRRHGSCRGTGRVRARVTEREEIPTRSRSRGSRYHTLESRVSYGTPVGVTERWLRWKTREHKVDCHRPKEPP